MLSSQLLLVLLHPEIKIKFNRDSGSLMSEKWPNLLSHNSWKEWKEI